MEFIYNGRDNTIDLGLVLDGDPVEASVPTKWLFVLEDSAGVKITKDSTIETTAFDVTQKERVSGEVVSILILKMGQEGIPAGRYTGVVTSIDPANLNGINWPSFPVTVVAA